MSRKPDDLELDYIHQIAKGSSKVQELIQAKNNEALDIQNKQSIKYKTPNPAPSPKGDIRLSKIHKEQTMDEKTLNDKIEQNNAKFDQQIKHDMETLVEHPDHKPVKDFVQEMNAKDIATLCEKGPDLYKEHKVREEKIIEKSLKLDFDDKDSFKDYQVYDDFLDNQKSMDVDKRPSPADEFE